MKKFLNIVNFLFLVCCGLFIAQSANSQGLEGIIVEEYYVTDAADAAPALGIAGPPAGSTVYRIYVDLAPDYFLQQVVGTGINPIEFATTTGFYNSPGASVSFGDQFAGFTYGIGAVPLDSYISLGVSGPNLVGVDKNDDNDGSAFGAGGDGRFTNQVIPIDVVDGNVAGAGTAVGQIGANDLSFVDVDGANSFFADNSGFQELAGAQGALENKVLIAQLTTDGELSFKLNLQIFNTNNETERYVHSVTDVQGGIESQIFPGLTFPSSAVNGCTDATACNFNAAATDGNPDAANCTFATGPCDECSGETDGTGTVVDNDADDDGVCDADEIAGCQDATACNFNSAATDPGSCEFATGPCDECSGETDGTGTVIDNDADDDGVCDADEIAGCQDASACNFNSAATDPGSCVFADELNCLFCIGNPSDGTGTVEFQDQDSDGVCDSDEVPGCTNENASNFDPNATDDDGSCIFDQSIACDGQPGGLEGIIVEEYYVTDANDAAEAFGIAGPSAGSTVYRVFVDLAPGYSLQQVVGTAINPIEFATTTGFYNAPGASVSFGDQFAGFTYGVGAVPLDSYISLGVSGPGLVGVEKTDDNDGSTYGAGGDGRFLNQAQPIDVVDGNVAGAGTPVGQIGANDLSFVDVNGANAFFADNSGFQELAGAQGAIGNKVLIGQFTTDGELSFKLNLQIFDANGQTERYVHSVVDTQGGITSRKCADLIFPGIPGCTDATACNFDADATIDDDSCIIPVPDCSACNSNNDGLDPIDDDQDGVCNADEVDGCTDPTACNYDPTVDDGRDDGSCIVPVPNCTACDNEGNLIDIDADNDGVCDADDNCPTDPDKVEPGICGCFTPDTDTDNDGTPDCNDLCPGDPNKVDPGTCGCGVADVDSDSDGTLDCDDLCPNDPDKIAPGDCGCGVADTDSDNDSDGPDCIDPCPLLPDLQNGDPCTTQGGESGFVQDCECVPGAKPQCISPVACNYFDPTGLVEGPQGDYINDPSLCDEPVGCKTCDASVDPDDVDENGNPTPDGDGIGAAIFPDGTDENNNMICDEDEPFGCTSSTACNYDPAAVNDDGSCLEPSDNCIVCGPNGSLIFIDSDGDGICNAEEVPGCTFEFACNYNPQATDNDGSCLIPEPGCSVCVGNTLELIDTDDDGTPNCEEVYGCTDINACNYDESATEDNGSCLVEDPGCTVCIEVQGQTVLVTIDSDGDGICDADEVPGCTDATACNYDPAATDDDGSCLVPTPDCTECEGDVLVTIDSDFDGICDADEVPGCTDALACNYDPAATDDDGSCEFAEDGCTSCVNGQLVIQDNDLDGICNADDPDDDNDGCIDANDPEPFTASADSDGDGFGDDCDVCFGDDNSGDTDGDGICDDSEIPGCTSATACNYDPSATDDDGSCLEPVENCLVCLDGDLVLVDSDGDKVCDADEVPGCTDEAACNYNPEATDDDGSCAFVVDNCTRCEDGQIEIIDTDGDGICDADEVPGCTDLLACNYNADATDDNGSCIFPVDDCLACSQDGSSLVLIDSDNDGVCDAEEVPGCTDEKACNYNPEATDEDGSCILPVEDCEECAVVDGEIVLVLIDTDGDGICDADEVPGCTDEMACNYNADATDDDGSCFFATENCTECGLITLPNGQVVPGLILIDSDGDKVCDAEEVPGCTNLEAVNYDPNATDDDGSCIFDCIVGSDCESFEDGFGAWTNRSDDDINWTANAGSTPSNGTGPDAAFEGSEYIYVEASFPNYPNKTAVLESPCYEVNGPSFVKFAYHMEGRGNSVGSLTLEIKATPQSAFVPLVSFSGSQGGEWNLAQVELPAITDGQAVQFRLVGMTANSFLGDIAVDDFCVQSVVEGCTDPLADNYMPEATFDDGSCSFLDCPNVRNLPYCRSFNSQDNFGGYINSTDDDFDWLQNNGSTQSMFTGPSSGSQGSGYLYIEASAPNNPFKLARLESPCLDLSSVADPAVSFSYHMWGAYVGQLALEVSTNGVDWDLIWLQQGNQGNQWNDASISLADYQGETVRLRFTGFTSHGWQGDMAIDDICVDDDPEAPSIVIDDRDPILVPDLSKETVEFQAPEFEASAELDVTLYPNPLNPSAPLNIQFFGLDVETQKVQVRIMDITGRMIVDEQYATNGNSAMFQTLELNSADLADGTYLVSIVAGDQVIAKRLVIAK